jgi:hypothetical protein
MNLVEGRGASHANSKNVFRAYISSTPGSVKFSDLAAVLNGQSNYGKPGEAPAAWQQAVTVLDHLIHQGPRTSHMVIKKSFFKKNQKEEDLGSGVRVRRGVYASIKPVLMGMERGKLNISLGINIDATTACFWASGSLLNVILKALGFQNATALSNEFRKVAKNNEKGWASTRYFAFAHSFTGY